jgi:plasmid stabilization system protein ParE
MRIRILEIAERDLEAGYEFYETQQSGVGTYFLDSLCSEIDSLVLYAGIHRCIFGYHRQLCRRFPYAIYYTIEEDVVLIWRILDLRRDPTWISDQLRMAP